MAVGPIPWWAIAMWCNFHELDREATQIMLAVIRELDVDRAEREEAKRRADEQDRKRKAATR